PRAAPGRGGAGTPHRARLRGNRRRAPGAEAAAPGPPRRGGAAGARAPGPAVRLGLFGGTFDPIHLGHLRAAENALECLALDRVAFVPAAVPPHRAEPLSSALDRYAMTALATAGHPRFAVSDVELRRDGPSYTVDTVAGLRRESP